MTPITSNSVTKRFFPQGEQIGANSYYYTRDHLGSVRELTDSDGIVRARYDYDPYGRYRDSSGQPQTQRTNLITLNPVDADFGFTGYYWNSTASLDLTYYRAYDPNLGRWLSRDPIAEDGGINLYGYVENNPSNRYDQLGLDPAVPTPDANYDSYPAAVAAALEYASTLSLRYNHQYEWGGNLYLTRDNHFAFTPADHGLAGEHGMLLRDQCRGKRGDRLADYHSHPFPLDSTPSARRDSAGKLIGGDAYRAQQTGYTQYNSGGDGRNWAVDPYGYVYSIDRQGNMTYAPNPSP